MAYCAAEDVARILQGRMTISSTSVPSNTDVEAFIAETEALINSMLASCGYTVPVTGSTDVVLLRGIVADIVAVKSYEVGFDDESPFLETLKTKNDGIMAKIGNCELVLPDQASSGGSSIGVSRIRVFDDGDDD